MCMYIVIWHMYVCMYKVIWYMYVCRYMAYEDYLSSHVLLLQLLMFSHLLVRCVLGTLPLPVAAEMTLHWSGVMTVCK